MSEGKEKKVYEGSGKYLNLVLYQKKCTRGLSERERHGVPEKSFQI
jgi:hypothetical protein